jgi:hypothetical protein
MLWADTMMDTAQPGFKVRKYQMNDGHEFFANLRVAPLRDGDVGIAALCEFAVAAPVIRKDFGARCHNAVHEAAERLGAAVGHQDKSDTSRVTASPSWVEFETGFWFSLSHLDGASHEGLMVHAAPLSVSFSTHPGFIYLDVFIRGPSNTVLVGTHHADTQLMEYLEGSLVARQTQLSLKLAGRHAGSLAGDQIGRPKPYRERCVRALHDRAGGKAGVTVAMAASQNSGTIGKAIRLICHATVLAHEPFAPAGAFKMAMSPLDVEILFQKRRVHSEPCRR